MQHHEGASWFGFVLYVDPADAKHYLDGEILRGWELTVVFAEENRKKPSEMRASIRGISYDHIMSPLRYSRSPCYGSSYSRGPSYYSPPPRQRSISPWNKDTASSPTQGHLMTLGGGAGVQFGA